MYYLLRAGEYTVKKYKSKTKQTKQFKMEDVTFFKPNKHMRLQLLGEHGTEQLIMTLNGFTPIASQQSAKARSNMVYLHCNKLLQTVVVDSRTPLRESTFESTRYSEHVIGWP
jgi:hypothetical protein